MGGAEGDNLGARARRGIRLLLGRQAAIQVLTFAGGVVLARTLVPAEFGIFGVATFLVAALKAVGGFGLAPSLIQREAGISERDLQVAFTVQQVLVTAVVVALWALAPVLVGLYPEAPAGTAWLVRALAIGLYLSSWRAMSALQLERRLEYRGLAFVEVVESLSYQVVAVGMAVLGFGVWSLVVAVLVRSLLGAALIFRAAPWRVRFAFDRRLAWELVRYGVPFQAQTLVHQLQNWVAPIVVAGMIGPQALGFLMWASPNGKKPLLVLDSVARVTFPHMARQQNDPVAVERTLKRALNVLLIPCAIWAALIAVAGHEVVELIYTTRWTPAVPALTAYAALSGIVAATWLTETTLSATGRVVRTTMLIGVRSVLVLGLGTFLVLRIGFIGVPIAEIVATALLWAPIASGLGRGVAWRVISAQAWLAIPVVATLAAGWALGHVQVSGLVARAAVLTIGPTVAFGLATWVAAPAWMRHRVLTAVRPKLGLSLHATP